MKLSDVGTKASNASGDADPDNGTPKFPTLVSRVAIEAKTWEKLPDEPGGVKVTVKVTEALLARVPLAGAPVMLKGVEVSGEVKPTMLMELPELFVMVTVWLTGRPLMGWRPKFTDVGDATILEVAPTPLPLRVTIVVPNVGPVVVLAVSDPALTPMTVGVNVTGTEID
jgi:hypothetical protein